MLLLLLDVTETAHETVARTGSSWRLNGSCSLRCWKGWASACQKEREKEPAETCPAQ